jgi:hypothetical protein
MTADDNDSPDVLARARAQARLERLQHDQTAAYAADPWLFLSNAVWTLDQIRGEIRPFPREDYLQTVCRAWHKSRLLLIPKSRRMMITWTMVALHYWLARFRPGTTVAFVSRKEGRSESEGSAELVARAKFIHDHLPPEVEKIDTEYKFCRLTFPSIHSEILGIGQGPDQLRQLTLTAIFADEMSFWETARDAYIASRPTIEGGGRFTGVSSAGPGFFEQLVNDTV